MNIQKEIYLLLIFKSNIFLPIELWQIINKINKKIYTINLYKENQYGNIKKFFNEFIYKEDFEMVKYLIDSGIDIKKNDEVSLTRAADIGNLKIVKYLIQNGANHRNSLFFAVRGGNIEVIKYLIQNGYEINEDNEILNSTIRRGDLEMVKYLIQNGADIMSNYTDAIGNAIIFGRLNIVKYLIQNEFSENHEYDNDIIRLSVINEQIEIIKYLIQEIGYDEDFLTISVCAGKLEIVKYLIQNGADVKIISNDMIDIIKFKSNFFPYETCFQETLQYLETIR